MVDALLARDPLDLGHALLLLQRRPFGEADLEDAERPRDRADLVAPAQRVDRRREIAVGDADDRLGHAAQGAHRPRQREPEQRAEHQQDDQAEPDRHELLPGGARHETRLVEAQSDIADLHILGADAHGMDLRQVDVVLDIDLDARLQCFPRLLADRIGEPARRERQARLHRAPGGGQGDEIVANDTGIEIGVALQRGEKISERAVVPRQDQGRRGVDHHQGQRRDLLVEIGTRAGLIVAGDRHHHEDDGNGDNRHCRRCDLPAEGTQALPARLRRLSRSGCAPEHLHRADHLRNRRMLLRRAAPPTRCHNGRSR